MGVTPDDRVGDFDAALAFLSRQSGVDAARMGAAGGRCGVNNAIPLARRHDNLKALALLAGPADRDARAFIEAPGAPPVFAAAAADDRYGDFVLVSSWQFGISPRTESRFAQYPGRRTRGGCLPRASRACRSRHAVVRRGAERQASLAAANLWRALPPAVLQGLRALEQFGGAAGAHPLLPECIVNWWGYEHLALKDTATALEMMKLNATAYPASAQDSLGDTYLAAGDNASALTTAKRTLQLLDADTKLTLQQKTGLRPAADAKIAKVSAR